MENTILGLPARSKVPTGWHPIEAVAVVKCLDEVGDPQLVMLGTPTLSEWEAAGMLMGAFDEARSEMRHLFEEDPDDA